MIGFTAGSFDLLHAGHVMMLEEAKSVCDYLIVWLHVDPRLERQEKNKPVQSLIERQLQLGAIKYVDQVVVYSTEKELEELLEEKDDLEEELETLNKEGSTENNSEDPSKC